MRDDRGRDTAVLCQPGTNIRQPLIFSRCGIHCFIRRQECMALPLLSGSRRGIYSRKIVSFPFAANLGSASLTWTPPQTIYIQPELKQDSPAPHTIDAEKETIETTGQPFFQQRSRVRNPCRHDVCHVNIFPGLSPLGAIFGPFGAGCSALRQLRKSGARLTAFARVWQEEKRACFPHLQSLNKEKSCFFSRQIARARRFRNKRSMGSHRRVKMQFGSFRR